MFFTLFRNRILKLHGWGKASQNILRNIVKQGQLLEGVMQNYYSKNIRGAHEKISVVKFSFSRFSVLVGKIPGESNEGAMLGILSNS